jgi:hypothetical protein
MLKKRGTDQFLSFYSDVTPVSFFSCGFFTVIAVPGKKIIR